MKPFDHKKFLGYVCEVTPNYVRVQVPTSVLLGAFYLEGSLFKGGVVGSFVTIEGHDYGFLGRIYEVGLPQSEKNEITESKLNSENTIFHPVCKIELLGVFDVYHPERILKTSSRFPTVGAKVFSCSNEQMTAYISKYGVRDNDYDVPVVKIGRLTSNNSACHISLNSVFGRHCAVLGTTGGGKSWTVAKLIETIVRGTRNKCIIIDATGEYSEISSKATSIKIGTGEYKFNYTNLSIDELYFLLRPSSKVQVPKLMDAIRSLKISRLDERNQLTMYYSLDASGQIIKKIINKEARPKLTYNQFYYRNVSHIEDNTCNFDFTLLPFQLTNECVWDNAENWGGKNQTDLGNCISLISRVNNIMSTPEYNNIFGFRDKIAESEDLIAKINSFLSDSNSILRLDFSEVSFDYQVREILVNAIGQHLIELARSGCFKENPIVVFIDEAHQFLNKSISDEYFSAKPLNAFEKISKEARKYGLFLCISTQMPRDIPLGTLSQMGTFIVHRLINEQDKKAVEAAASAANRNSLSFLPSLGEGEALVLGVDFPMPLTIKIDIPLSKPNSQTPKLKAPK
ncbi:ATP-binding protein [uncultured Bacteroides sp.]|uniref:ATP-binding protein n=1 Tax=uncultured Bacteroides sp. TaxID=162156 RepID=UPI0025965275|nr:ATP-binding protein [uncultured Bacteroides sp.]